MEGIRDRYGPTLLRMLSLVLGLLLWHVAVQAEIDWPLILVNLPDPLEVLGRWWHLLGTSQYYIDVLASLGRVLVGVILASVLAIPIGLLTGRSAWAESMFTSFDLFRSIPLIALVPIVTLIVPSVELAIITVTFTGAFFPLMIQVRNAVRRMPRSYLLVCRSMRASSFQTVWMVVMPALLPHIVSGLSIAVGTSWMGVITAEIMSGKTGIGYFTSNAYLLMQHADTLVGTFTIGLIGFGSVGLVKVLERLLLRYEA